MLSAKSPFTILTRFLICACAMLFASISVADIRLPRLISDGAVLQRDKPVVIWGWADEGENISVTFAGRELATQTESERWSVTFPARKAGGPYTLEVRGKNTIRVNDLWMGDVWIGAGQSNLELPLRRVHYQYPDVIAQTNLPQIREFNVPLAYTFKENASDYTQGQWKTATPENLAGFSAVGFFFARHLHQSLDVPIGLVSLSVGGSPAEAWMSETALEKYPQHLAAANQFKNDGLLQQTIAADKARSDAWYGKAHSADLGLQGEQPWSAEKLSTNDWQTFEVPGFFKEQKIDFINGVVWLRKTIKLSESQARAPAHLWLGAIVDGDQVYINGTSVGQTGYRYPPRIYHVPENLLKAGENTISIRITSYSSDPGFVKDKLYALKLGNQQIDLQGQWHYQIGMHAEPMPPSTTLHYQPASLFKAKLAPMLGFPIKGVIWYQGESNVGRATEYHTLFPDLISDWRAQFKQGDFPFLFVQLANFLEPKTEPGESAWADLREVQRNTLRLPNTAMAVAIDIGEWNDIHPLNKQAVGERLALAAHKVAYGNKTIVASGPTLLAVTQKGKQLVLTFDSLDKGLRIEGDELKEIAIAGDDKQFVWAKAKIRGKQLLVWSDTVTDPKWVRYGWADNPAGANLYNSAGLPASPFEARVVDK